MTTLDDAAERQEFERWYQDTAIALGTKRIGGMDSALCWFAWRAATKLATEAAALKCEVKIKREAGFGGRWEGYGAFDDWMIGPECAAAIRGKGG